MKYPEKFKFVAQLLGVALLIEVVILGVVALIGWRLGWQGVDPYRDAIQIAGLSAIGFGLFGIKGNWDATRSFTYQYSMTASNQSSWQRTQQTLVDFAQAFSFMILMFIVGGVNLLLGWIF